MPMGLKNAPKFFQMQISRLFSEYSFIKVFVDDIIIFSGSLELHYEHLNIALDILHKEGLTVRVDKSNFITEEILYLGLRISKDGIQPNTKKNLTR